MALRNPVTSVAGGGQGWISEGSDVDFAGSAIVDSETVLSQSDVFSGAEVDDFYEDDEYTPDQ